MKWEGERESDNVEDRRSAGGFGGFGGGLPGLGIGGRGIGIGTVIVALLAGWIFGINPLTLLGILGGGGAPTSQVSAPPSGPPADDPQSRFVRTVLASTEDVWRGVFQAGGTQYQPPRLVLFRGGTPTACGTGQTAMGPFYCPGDQRVYLDMEFFDTMRQRLGAPGDFAQAYVIAHEIGHHVQNLLGISRQVHDREQQTDEASRNALSVRLELQADFYAGVWAHHANQRRPILEEGDVEEAIGAAAAVGDDTIQRKTTGHVQPETWTHGSAAQRSSAFKKGFSSGVDACM